MTRILLVQPSDADEATQARLLGAERANGFLPNLLGLLANAPNVLEAYQVLTEINSRGSLSLAEREIVQITAAATHGCGFCVAGHTKLALLKAGLSQTDVSNLRDLRPIENKRLAAVQAFTREVIAARGGVSDAAYADFVAAGYDGRAALEVVLGVGLATICNFANNLGQVPLNPELADFRWEQPQVRAAE